MLMSRYESSLWLAPRGYGRVFCVTWPHHDSAKTITYFSEILITKASSFSYCLLISVATKIYCMFWWLNNWKLLNASDKIDLVQSIMLPQKNCGCASTVKKSILLVGSSIYQNLWAISARNILKIKFLYPSQNTRSFCARNRVVHKWHLLSPCLDLQHQVQNLWEYGFLHDILPYRMEISNEGGLWLFLYHYHRKS